MTDDNHNRRLEMTGKVLMRGDISDEEHGLMLELAKAITALAKYHSERGVFAKPFPGCVGVVRMGYVADGECAVEIVANTDCAKEVLLPNGRFVPNADWPMPPDDAWPVQ